MLTSKFHKHSHLSRFLIFFYLSYLFIWFCQINTRRAHALYKSPNSFFFLSSQVPLPAAALVLSYFPSFIQRPTTLCCTTLSIHPGSFSFHFLGWHALLKKKQKKHTHFIPRCLTIHLLVHHTIVYSINIIISPSVCPVCTTTVHVTIFRVFKLLLLFVFFIIININIIIIWKK